MSDKVNYDEFDYDDALNSAPATMTQWVTFTVADEIYAVNVLDVQEVLRNAEITPVTGAPMAVIGIINLRGNVVTVVDARIFFNLPEKPMDESSRVVVVELENEEVVGVVVDSVAEVIELPEETVNNAPAVSSEENSRHILGVVSLPEKLVILVDFNGLMEIAKGG